MKPTKYCNLRCTYCYEYAYLNDPRRMSLDQLATFFRSVADYSERNGVEHITFTWHGGEPFVIPLMIYDQIKELQERIFGNIEIVNGIQTNLTILTDQHIAHLRSGQVFDNVSISFDVTGDQRVDKKGRPTTQTVLDNMQRLIDAGVPFAAICVLSRSTVAEVLDLYQFFQEIRTPCRFLPFHRNTDGTGNQEQALSQADIVGALSTVFDKWMAAEDPIVVRPLADLVEVAHRSILREPRRVYDKEVDEWTYVVNPDGDLWGISEIEDNRFKYGNVFCSSFGEVLASDGRSATFRGAKERIRSLCTGCPYLGHCSGYPMADVTDGVFRTVLQEGCHTRALLDHIIRRLEETGVAEEIKMLEVEDLRSESPGQ